MNSKSTIETMQAKIERLREHIRYSFNVQQKRNEVDATDTDQEYDDDDNNDSDNIKMAKAFFAGAFAVKVEFARGFKPSELPIGVEFYAYGIPEEFMFMSAFFLRRGDYATTNT